MEYPGPGKDYQKIYWSTSARVKKNLPFLVYYVHRSSRPGTPKRVSNLYKSRIYIDQPVIKIEDISCKLNVNPQAQSADIMSLPSLVSEKTDRMQENFGASPAISADSPISETIHGGQVIDADPGPLNCMANEPACIPASISSTDELVTTGRLGCYPFCSDTFNCYTTSTREKKPNLLKKVLSYFNPFPTPDLAASGACKNKPKRKKA